MKRIKGEIITFLKEIYDIWFPWLDIAILTLIYLFLWGEHINPYGHYQLIKYGKVAVGKISGEAGLYQYSDRPRMRDFVYTFTLPNGKIIKSSAHTFTLDRKNWKKPTYPVIAEISYLPHQLGVIPKVAASFFAKWPHLSLQSVHSISPESVHSADFKAF